jgi:N-acetylneuraminic acid mutarotase
MKKIVELLVVLVLGVVNPNIVVAAGEWFQKTSGATARTDHTAVVHNGKMYVFAGDDHNSGILNDLWEYDIATDTWTQKTSGPVSRDCHSAVIYNDQVYIFGGYQDEEPHRANDVWKYDITNNSWTQKTSGATGRNNHTAVVYDGKMYIFGGKDNDRITLNDLWEYDIATDSWAQKSSAPVASRAHTAVAYNGKMYIFGGSDNNDAISDELWTYDFSSDAWAQENSGPFPTADHSAVVYNDKMYIFGAGYIDVQGNIVLCNELWEYDFATDGWSQQTTIGTSPSERATHTAVVCNDKMYIFGGGISYENETWEHVNDLWAYEFDGGGGGGNFVTSDLWIKAVINTEERGPIEAVWQKGGEDTTSAGDRVIWGHFYASPDDVTWGSEDNPDLFVKIWFDHYGRLDVNFFHVSVPDIVVYSDYPYDGIADEQGTTTMSTRYIRQYYENSQSYSEDNYEDGNPPSGYSQTGNPTGYSTINDLRIGAIIDTVEKGGIDALWRLGGQDTTSRGDRVVWGHFYASPSDVTWGSSNNPDLFMKIWFDVSGRVDVNFFHVSVPDIEVYSDLPNDSTYDQQGTTIMNNRYIRHEYWR